MSNYDKRPIIPVGGTCWTGWKEIVQKLRADGARTVAIECYPGVFVREIMEAFGAEAVDATQILKSPVEIDALVARDLTDDPVFGRMNGFTIRDFVDEKKLADLQAEKPRIVVGTGASLVVPDADVVVYANMPRWEIQLRQRAGTVANFGADNSNERASLKYKRAFFLDWRAADRLKKQLLPKCDFLLDTTQPHHPKLVTGDAYRSALRQATTRPFRVVPFFDPGPWGGQWMRRVCDLPDGPPNYAWCFDCVPEENSLLLGFGNCEIEVPAIDLVFQHPRELLGDPVHGRFGTEFPIRFDFLDTMDGGDLSFQVHPLTEYVYDKFGLTYTQDESYYLLDAAPDAAVYLGLKPNVDRRAMERDLRAAQDGAIQFDAEKYANKWPAKRHDHFLIPAGTVHCSGKNSMVLEISATPYIFTFKMWDWGRLGLDGRPRPVHLDHGIANIQWDRDTDWTRKNLINCFESIGAGPGWTEERTGLHEREFIETRRHWFTEPVEHQTNGSVHVLNLVEGEEAVVESPANAFEPYTIHYAESFIVPEAVKTYRIRPIGRCATVRASVRH